MAKKPRNRTADDAPASEAAAVDTTVKPDADFAASTGAGATGAGASDAGAAPAGATSEPVSSRGAPGTAADTRPDPATAGDPEGSAAAGKRDGIALASGALSGLVPKLAIVVAILASLIAGALWWQYRQFYVSLAADDSRLERTLEDTRAYARRLEDEIDALRGQIAASSLDVDALEGELDALPAGLRALERRVEALQGGQLNARDSWLREQAEYYLVLANSELRLGGRVASAIAALESADDVLRELADPALGNVRAAISAERLALGAVDVADVDRIVFDLAGFGARISALPLRDAAPEDFGVSDTAEQDAEPGLGRLWARTRGALLSIVRIERQEEPVGQLLTESERRIVRRQLELEVQVARTAALDRRSADYRSSLVAADAILNRDFDREARSVIDARRLLGDLMQHELEPALPEIGDSLTLLRAASGAR